MIEKVQKQVIFEEAARKGIMNSQILQIPDILREIIGVADINKQQYGMPLAPTYTAKSGELIDIARISNFFTGLSRDVKVSNQAITNLENDLLLFNLEIWTRMQLLKNKSQSLSKKAKIEKVRASFGATWIYTETFSNTNLIDMQNTTAWLDTAEGISFIPNSGNEKTVPMQNITLVDSSLPETSDFLGSNPKQAFDGLDSTNWRCLFINDEYASATYSLSNPSNITAISIDPVGFGISVLIEAEVNGVFEKAVQAIVYSKKTFPIYKPQATKIKVSYKCATASLPKVTGIREIVLFQSVSVKTAEIISSRLKPSDAFTEIKILTKGEVPQGTKISSYYRTATGAAWQEARVNEWNPLYPTDTTSLSVSYTDAVPNTSLVNFTGLYGKGLPISAIPVTTTEGIMDLGTNMVEVSVFKKDWLEEGELPKLLSPADFSNFATKKAWSYVPIKAYTGNGSGTCVQLYGETTIKNDTGLTRGGPYMLFQRKLDDVQYPSSISTYNQMCIVPLVGAKASGMMQADHNYRISFMVYAPKAFSYQDSKYWFYQGYRLANKRLYKDIGKSFGTFSIYINDQLVASEETAKTISTDNKIEGNPLTQTDLGQPFTMNFNEGWNKVEILMNVIDPSKYGSDAFDVQDQPFLQLSIYPCLFDSKFADRSDTYISKIIASGQYKPVNEFDLLWSLPRDPSFWAWSNDRQYLLFNTNTLQSIDGYYFGSVPISTLNYKSVQSDSVDDLYIKVVLEREDSTQVSPIIDEYNVMVR